MTAPIKPVCRNAGRGIRRARVEHGEVVRAGKCQRCLDVYERSRPKYEPGRIKARRVA